MTLLKHGAWLAAWGVLHGWSLSFPRFGTPWDGEPLWWLQMLSLAMLLRALILPPIRTPKRVRFAAMQGFAFSLGWLLSVMWWLYVSMHTYAGLSRAVALSALVLFVGFLSLFHAAACALFMALQSPRKEWPPLQTTKPVSDAVLFATCWLLGELVRATLWTGLPWGSSGYAHVQSPLSGLAPYVGVYGIGFVSAFGVACFVLSRSCLFKLLLLLGMVYGLYDLNASPSPSPSQNPDPSPSAIRLTILQGNIPQEEKFDQTAGIAPALDWYGQQIQAAKGEVVLAPETAIPVLAQQLPVGYLQALQPTRHTAYKAVLTGIPMLTAKGDYTNSVLGLSQAPASYRYDKHHLVPFGEFIPPLFRWFTDWMRIPLGDFERGGVDQPSFALTLNGVRQYLAPMICFEDLFGEELAKRFVGEHPAPTVLVNFSNLGWFGDTVILPQHLHISRMRALEFNRPIVRATNTGVSGVIDHEGRITHRLPVYTRGVLEAFVEPQQTITPYARWMGRYGVAAWFAFCGGVLVIAVWAKRRSVIASLRH